MAEKGLLVTAYVDGPGADPARNRWRVHPMLREVLQERAEEWEPTRRDAATVHARAARHYAAAGDPARAVRQATRGNDLELLGDLVVDLGVDLIMLGESTLLDAALVRLEAVGRASAGPAADPALAALRALLLRGLHREADAKSVADLAVPRGL